jgi:xylonate dehydratase
VPQRSDRDAPDAQRDLIEGLHPQRYEVVTTAEGPSGELPLSAELLRDAPSGDLFGLSQNVGMGWKAREALAKQFLILSTSGGLRDADGTPVALGYHTGHWELDALVRECARELTAFGHIPFAGFCSDPCDGRTQGTTGMFDSLPYRNDAATVLRRLIRSLPRRRGVVGIATCDKGLPAMLMAVASASTLPGIVIPGGVTLPPTQGEDAGTIQSLGARFARGEVTLREAAELGCRACATPGGGCQFLGTAATSQVIAEALGLTVPHAALAPSGQPVWLDVARRSALAIDRQERAGVSVAAILTPAAVRNAMVVHAAFGGSTNLLLHLPAIAHAAGLTPPTVVDWTEVNRRVPRLVSVLPNGPVDHPTVRVFLAGGVPEVMLHLQALGLLDVGVMTAAGETLGEVLDRWAASERRRIVRALLRERDGVDPDEVILTPERAAAWGLARTLSFPRGNLAPQGAVTKSTAIDPSVLGGDGRFVVRGPARPFVSERAAITAIKAGEIRPGDVMVLAGVGPSGTGMEEIYQITAALKHLSFGKFVTVITDGRFSGVSTGACIGHVSPEALAGGPIGRVREGDTIEVVIDPQSGGGSVDLVATAAGELTPEGAAAELAARAPHPDLAPHPALPDDTRLWALLQSISGGTWAGCVYDVGRIHEALAGRGASLTPFPAVAGASEAS